MTDVKTVPVVKFGAFATPWDPADYGGEVETWESMRKRLDAALPDRLARRGLQMVGEPEYRRQDDMGPFTRRLYATVRAITADAPPSAVREAELTPVGYVSWHDDQAEDD